MRQQWARIVAAGVVAGALLVACGGDEDPGASTAAPAGNPAPPAATAPVSAPPEDAQLAVAVADAKTSAPIDLLYDLPAKPEVGQPFAIELTVKPRVAGDALDVEIGDSPGITIEGERQARFLETVAGEPYKLAVQARSDTEGLYYVTVNAKLSSQVQSQAKSWSVPVVIGAPPAVQDSPPPTEASGQPTGQPPPKP